MKNSFFFFLICNADIPGKNHNFWVLNKKIRNGAKAREITFEKFRVLQSDTVAMATLYQQTISIFHMDVLCSFPLSAWQVLLYRQPQRWPTSYPTRLELQRRGKRHERCSQTAGGRGKTKLTKLLTVAFIRRFLSLSVAVIIIFCIPVGKNADFSAILNHLHWMGRKHNSRGCWLLCVVVFISLITSFWIRLFIRLK